MSSKATEKALLRMMKMLKEVRQERYPEIKQMLQDVDLLSISKGTQPLTLEQVVTLETDPLKAKVAHLLLYTHTLSCHLRVVPKFGQLMNETKKVTTERQMEVALNHVDMPMVEGILCGEVKITAVHVWVRDRMGESHSVRITPPLLDTTMAEVMALMEKLWSYNMGNLGPAAKR